jgi:hypothetical protein
MKFTITNTGTATIKVSQSDASTITEVSGPTIIATPIAPGDSAIFSGTIVGISAGKVTVTNVGNCVLQVTQSDASTMTEFSGPTVTGKHLVSGESATFDGAITNVNAVLDLTDPAYAN